ncbi:MAG: hypothetical protein ABSF57_09675 [Acidobacteriaceae bacterium]
MPPEAIASSDLRQLASDVLSRALKAGATDAEVVLYEGDEFSTLVRLGQVETLKESGSRAVGLFNRGEEETTVTAKWTDLGVTGPQTVRDLWRQKDIGDFNGEFHASVPRHGVVLVKVTPAREEMSARRKQWAWPGYQ